METDQRSAVGDCYVLATGEEGAHRLRVMNMAYGPYTERLLAHIGLAEGRRVADIGCGIGTVSCWMAERVGPSGSVVGVDVSAEQVALARKIASEAGLTNITFVEANAYETGLPRDSFDLVFCRFLLIHLQHPAVALQEMRALVKPGGLLVCEDMDMSSPFCEPPTEGFSRLPGLLLSLGDKRGLDFRLGAKLYCLFLEAGFRAPEVALAQPAFVRGDGKRLGEWSLLEAAPAIVEMGLATREEIDQIAAIWRAVSADETILVGIPRVTQVWAWKD